MRGGVQAVRAEFSPQALCFRAEGQLLFYFIPCKYGGSWRTIVKWYLWIFWGN